MKLASELKKKSTSLEDELEHLEAIRNNGLKKGAWLGFSELDKLWTLKRGSTTYLVAPPHVGKTSFLNEIIDNLIEYSGFKVIIFSPETGSTADMYIELLWTACKRPFVKNKAGVYSSDSEVSAAYNKIKDNVRVLDFGLVDVTIGMIYEEVTRLRDEEDFNADLLIVDPMAEIKTQSSVGMREDIAIGEVLNKVRRYSSKYDIHTILAVHTVKMEKIAYKTVAGDKVFSSPPATMGDIAGGQAYSRKGMMIVTLWRAPEGVEKPNSEYGMYRDNETVITVVKAKPKAVGSVGSCSLYYDKIANRYYELRGENENEKVFSYDCPRGFEEREISPNNINGMHYEAKMKLNNVQQTNMF